MKILLAPMEGVIDHHMRHTLTAIGGYDGCVTEFLRITDQRLPARVFRRTSPELAQQGHTPAGIPVTFQLLGGDTDMMAANARKAVELGAPSIDINFGCPSRFVSRKNGGAVLLREPQRVHDIVAAVRSAVEDAVPISAKMRLGYEDDSLAMENAMAIETAGAEMLTVHARTKAEGYKPPARWEALAPVREALTIPVIANGDIRTVEDYRRCREVSGCEDVMLGRGVLSNPLLARQIRIRVDGMPAAPMEWDKLARLMVNAIESMRADYPEKYIVMRIKQWVSMVRHDHPQAMHLFADIRTLRCLPEIQQQLMP